MNVLEGIDALKNGLMWVGLSALAAIAVGVVGAWLCRGVASATRRLLTVARIIAFAVVSAFCVLRGGAKVLQCFSILADFGSPQITSQDHREGQEHSGSSCQDPGSDFFLKGPAAA